jgi:hypothetical protein
MLWMLLVYVVAGSGFNVQPTLAPSFHGATFQTKEECEAAARTLSTYATPGLDDFAKVGLFTVCAPVLPPPPAPPKAEPAPAQQPMFPVYPPPKRH